MSDFQCKAGALIARKQLGGGTRKHILRTLADLSNAKGFITASVPEIGAVAEVADRTVQNHIKAFLAEGLIEKRGETGGVGRKHNVYSLNLDAISGLKDTDLHRSSENTGAASAPRKAVSPVQEIPFTGAFNDAAPVQQMHPLYVEDISLPLEVDHIGSDQRASAPEPLVAVVVKVDWPARLEQALERAGKAINAASPGLRHYADLRRLCEPAKGVPCDWEHDVLPAIDKVAASFLRSGKTLRAWTLIEEHAVANRDNRLRGLAEPQTLFVDANGVEILESSNVSRIDRNERGGNRSGRSEDARRGPRSASNADVWGWVANQTN